MKTGGFNQHKEGIRVSQRGIRNVGEASVQRKGDRCDRCLGTLEKQVRVVGKGLGIRKRLGFMKMGLGILDKGVEGESLYLKRRIGLLW